MVEPAEVWKRTTVRAQVRHPCVGCGMFVCVGTAHERIDSLFDGEWATWRVHLECLELAISMQDPDDRTYDVHDVHGQLHDRGDDLRPWRELLDARRREQEGCADLCAWGLGRASYLTAWRCDAVAVPGELASSWGPGPRSSVVVFGPDVREVCVAVG